MLERIRIINFQCHKDLTIDFDTKVTCIVGESDKGKSAIIRALRWLSLNRPSGDSFIRHNQDSSSTILYLDGHKIKRKKGKESNEYTAKLCKFLRSGHILEKSDNKSFHSRLYMETVKGKNKTDVSWRGCDESESIPMEKSSQTDVQTFKAFGQEVPEEINKILNVSDLNFQLQLEPPYWFLKSAGEVSRELNSIVNLGLIDRTLANTASEVRKSKITVEVSSDRLNQAQKEKERLSWVMEAAEDLKEIDQLHDRISELREKSIRIVSILEDSRRYSKSLDRVSECLPGALELKLAGERVIHLKEKIDQIEEQLYTVAKLNNQLKETLTELESVQNSLRKINQCPACGKPMTL